MSLPTSTTPQPATDQQESSLKLTQEELKVCEKWVTPYTKLETSADRLKMLRERILPQLYLFNRELPNDAWKARKKVSIQPPPQGHINYLSRKQQIKMWFQNHSRGVALRSRLSFAKKISLKQVVCHEYKSEIAAIATRKSNGARAGSQAYLQVFQAAVDEFMETLDEDAIVKLEEVRANWMSRGNPPELQRKTAERSGGTYLEQSALVQYNTMGRRLVVWEFHENMAGTKLFQL
jgi:hypothetical protein